MKTIFLVAGCRAGLEFFQSLLDGHKEILQFPGIIKTNNELVKILSLKNSEEISSNFIRIYKHFFDSRLSNIERHNVLGENKNEFYTVDKEKFKLIFNQIFAEDLTFKIKNKVHENLIKLHQAYSLASNNEINSKKILIINCHLIEYIKFYEKKIRGVEFDILHSIRNPLSALGSAVNNWLKFDQGKHFFAKSIYFQLDVIVNAISELTKMKKNFLLVKLESLHQNHANVMRDFCKIYNITYNRSMEKSTFCDLKWWGDKVSGKDFNGINKNFSININNQIFYKRDIEYLEYILNDYIKIYGYKRTEKNSNYYFNFFPLKCEVLTWMNTLKHKKIKHILSIPFFYVKRLINIKKIPKNNLKIPHLLGESFKRYVKKKY